MKRLSLGNLMKRMEGFFRMAALSLLFVIKMIPYPRFPSRVLAVTFYLGTVITLLSLLVIVWTLNIKMEKPPSIDGHIIISCVCESKESPPRLSSNR